MEKSKQLVYFDVGESPITREHRALNVPPFSAAVIYVLYFTTFISPSEVGVSCVPLCTLVL